MFDQSQNPPNLDNFEEINQRQIAFTSSNLALVYQEIGDLETAFSIYKKSRQIVEKLGNDNYYGRLLDNIGVLYSMKGDYENAQVNLLASLKIRLVFLL